MKQLPSSVALKNPFHFGRELGVGELIDRRDELERIHRSMVNKGKLFLIGPRRYGKTSLLATAEAQAEKAGTVVLRFDAEQFTSMDALAQKLLTVAGRRLATTVEKATDMLKRFGSALLPAVKFDVAKSEMSVTLGVRDQDGVQPIPVFVDVLDTIEHMAEETGRSVTVIIDEFQAAVREGINAEKQIRATVQKHKHVSYIFAGSDTKLLADMTSKVGRPFYHLGSNIFLKAIPRDEFAAFLRAGFIDAGFTTSDEAISRILSAAEEVPHSVQRLAHECWEQTRVSPDKTLSLESVNAMVDRVCEDDGPMYNQIWTTLIEAQKKALIAVIEEGGVKLMSHKVSNKTRLAQTTIKSALDSLEKNGIIRQEQVGDVAHYRLQDPLFGRWLEFIRQADRRIV